MSFRPQRLVPLLIVVLLSVSCLGLLAPALVTIPKHVFLNYNEGWNAYHATNAFNSQLYPAPNELVTNNYPPLSFVIVAIFNRFVDDYVVAGRILALIGMLLTAANVAFSVGHIGKSRMLAFTSGAVFLAATTAFYPQYTATNDPQWLAHGIMTSGLVVFLKARHTTAGLTGCVILMISAGFIKHILLPVPTAVTLWLMVYERALLWRWLGLCTFTLLAAFSLLYGVYGQNFFAGILAPRAFALSLGLPKFFKWSAPAFCWIVCGFVGSWGRPACPEMRLVQIYVALATVFGLFACGGEGVAHNSVFDLVIAATIYCGSAWSLRDVTRRDDAERQWDGQVIVGAMLLLALPVLVYAPRGIDSLIALMENGRNQMAQREERTNDDVKFISARSGPVICEDLVLCFWAHKAFVYDTFYAGVKMRLGIISEEQFVQRLSSHEYDLVQIEAQNFRFTPRVLTALETYYHVERKSSNGLFYTPKPGQL